MVTVNAVPVVVVDHIAVVVADVVVFVAVIADVAKVFVATVVAIKWVVVQLLLQLLLFNGSLLQLLF